MPRYSTTLQTSENFKSVEGGGGDCSAHSGFPAASGSMDGDSRHNTHAGTGTFRRNPLVSPDSAASGASTPVS
jgi:hypothetical protein